MEETAKALIVAGTTVVAYGLILGIPLGGARMQAPAAPRHLVTTHLEALIGGAILVALASAASYSTLVEEAELLAVGLLIGGLGLSLVGGTLNWRSGTGDAFAVRSAGFYLQAAGGPLMVVGGLLLWAGVLKALLG